MNSRINKVTKYIRSDINRALIVALIFSLPFDRIPSFELAGISIRLSMLIGLIIIARTSYLLLTRNIKLSLNTQEKVILAFLFWIAIIIPESINITRAINIVIFSSFTILLGLSVAIIFDKSYIKPIIYSLFASALMAVAFAAYQYIGDIFGLPIAFTGLRDRYTWGVFGFPRVQAFSLEPLYLASYMLIPFSVALALTLYSKQKVIGSKLSSLLVFLFSLTIFMTVSRGGIYGMVIATILGLSAAMIFRLTNLKRIGLIVSALVLSFIASLLIINYLNKPPSILTKGAKGTTAYVEQIKNTGISDDGDERATARSRAVSLIRQNRLALAVGIGPGQYGPYIQNNKPTENGWTIINNLTLELILETGLIGLGLVCVYFALIFYKGLRIAMDSRDIGLSVLAAGICIYLISQAIQYQTFSTLYVVHIWVIAGLLMGIIRVTQENSSSHSTKSKNKKA
jgi:hypothetical protein